MTEEKEFWTLDSEKVPFRPGWFYRAYEFQQFMEKIEKDPRGGKIIGMRFDGKNVEFLQRYLHNNSKNLWRKIKRKRR